jgi:uncharacterized membrane protein YidH (DUF202 family)
MAARGSLERLSKTMTSQSGCAATDTTTLLAYDRTRPACERTMLAWVRTATALISFASPSIRSFSFTQGVISANTPLSPREVMFMIA